MRSNRYRHGEPDQWVYLRRCRQSLGNYRDLRSYLPIQRRKPVHLDLQFVVERLTSETAGLLSSRELKEHGPKNLLQVWFPACRLRRWILSRGEQAVENCLGVNSGRAKDGWTCLGNQRLCCQRLLTAQGILGWAIGFEPTTPCAQRGKKPARAASGEHSERSADRDEEGLNVDASVDRNWRRGQARARLLTPISCFSVRFEPPKKGITGEPSDSVDAQSDR